MVLDAASLIEWQACKRQFLLSQAWRPLRWRPKALFDACLRAGILSIVQQGELPAAAATVARAAFLQSAANPGLDITTDPFLAAKDWCAMLDTTLRGLTRAGLPPQLKEVPPVLLNSQVEWQPMAHVDGQSMLHRWITIDRWAEDDLSRELHSWRTIGDVAITKLPMTIHVIVIGQVRSGRRASAWARGWKHPTMPSLQMRFKGKQKDAFKSWKAFHLADSRVDPEAWVEQMEKEGVMPDLLRCVPVRALQDTQSSAVARDVLLEALDIQNAIEEARGWQEMPMSRNSCDGPVPCAFQQVCYAPKPLPQIEKTGLYQPRQLSQASKKMG